MASPASDSAALAIARAISQVAIALVNGAAIGC
jgi:hypothetical protein